jgi:8-oxo-dGTP pyrophosphatase MutT (NUDIX family)
LTGTIDVTVAAIIEQGDHYLLVEELVGGSLVLNQPAGHVEPREPILDAVIRETLEETGYRFTPDALTGIYTWTAPRDQKSFLRLCFCGTASPPEADVTLDEGIVAACWLDRDELIARQADLRSPLVMRAIDDYRAGRRYPLDCLHHIGPETSQGSAIRAIA